MHYKLVKRIQYRTIQIIISYVININKYIHTYKSMNVNKKLIYLYTHTTYIALVNVHECVFKYT